MIKKKNPFGFCWKGLKDVIAVGELTHDVVEQRPWLDWKPDGFYQSRRYFARFLALVEYFRLAKGYYACAHLRQGFEMKKYLKIQGLLDHYKDQISFFEV